MKRKLTAAGIALWLGMAATAAQAAVTPACVTKDEVQTVVTALIPDVLRGIGDTCRTSLPPAGILRDGLPPLVARYEPAAEAAWPKAIDTLTRMSGGEFKGIDPKLVRPLLSPMLASTLAKVKPGDCPRIDRAVTLIAPLPPENVPELVAMLMASGGKNDKKGPFSICPEIALPVVSTPAPPHP
jgi:hypothetical protein